MYGFLIVLKNIKNRKSSKNRTFFDIKILYDNFGDMMKVKLFDFEDETDLEKAINNFLNDDIEVVDIKYSVSSSIFSEEQIFCFSAMIIYY